MKQVQWTAAALVIAAGIVSGGENLLKNPDFHALYLQRMSEYLHGPLSDENYLELAHGLKQRGYVPVFLFGPAESIYVQETTDAGYPFISGLNFGEIACLMNATAYTKCIIGNDTGLMHLACALDVPSVTISAGESHFVWFPYEQQRHKVCHPSCSSQRCLQNCNNWKNCISIVAVNDVLVTVDALLGEH